jgi:hypothetical protein
VIPNKVKWDFSQPQRGQLRYLGATHLCETPPSTSWPGWLSNHGQKAPRTTRHSGYFTFVLPIVTTTFQLPKPPWDTRLSALTTHHRGLGAVRNLDVRIHGDCCRRSGNDSPTATGTKCCGTDPGRNECKAAPPDFVGGTGHCDVGSKVNASSQANRK